MATLAETVAEPREAGVAIIIAPDNNCPNCGSRQGEHALNLQCSKCGKEFCSNCFGIVTEDNPKGDLIACPSCQATLRVMKAPDVAGVAIVIAPDHECPNCGSQQGEHEHNFQCWNCDGEFCSNCSRIVTEGNAKGDLIACPGCQATLRAPKVPTHS